MILINTNLHYVVYMGKFKSINTRLNFGVDRDKGIYLTWPKHLSEGRNSVKTCSLYLMIASLLLVSVGKEVMVVMIREIRMSELVLFYSPCLCNTIF